MSLIIYPLGHTDLASRLNIGLEVLRCCGVGLLASAFELTLELRAGLLIRLYNLLVGFNA